MQKCSYTFMFVKVMPETLSVLFLDTVYIGGWKHKDVGDIRVRSALSAQQSSHRIGEMQPVAELGSCYSSQLLQPMS